MLLLIERGTAQIEDPEDENSQREKRGDRIIPAADERVDIKQDNDKGSGDRDSVNQIKAPLDHHQTNDKDENQ